MAKRKLTNPTMLQIATVIVKKGKYPDDLIEIVNGCGVSKLTFDCLNESNNQVLCDALRRRMWASLTELYSATGLETGTVVRKDREYQYLDSDLMSRKLYSSLEREKKVVLSILTMMRIVRPKKKPANKHNSILARLSRESRVTSEMTIKPGS